MIYDTAPVNWHEGMFIQPHHFQVTEQSINTRMMRQNLASPNNWGVASIVIDKSALEGFRLKIHRASFRMPEGTWVDIPGNAVVPEKSFKEHFEKANMALPVWAAIRKKEDHLPAIHKLGDENTGSVKPAVVREVEIEDDSTGDNEQSIQIRLWNVRLFFGDAPGEEYEAINLAEIVLAPQTDLPAVNVDYIPPLLNLSAAKGFREKLTNLVVHLNNQSTYIRRELTEKHSMMLADPANALTSLIRCQLTASFGLVLKQLTAMDETHPLQVYLELVRLAGGLSVLITEMPLDVPEYRHTQLTQTMERLFELIWSFLEGGVVPEFIRRDFELRNNTRVCPIDLDWIESDYPVYLCIETDMTDNEVISIISDLRVKMGPPSIIDELLAERRRGISCENIRKVPIGLQDRSGLHYFKLSFRDNAEFIDLFRKDLMLEVRGIPGNLLPDMKLFVHIKQS